MSIESIYVNEMRKATRKGWIEGTVPGETEDAV